MENDSKKQLNNNDQPNQKTQRLNVLFGELQQLPPRSFPFDLEEYRGSRLKEIEALITSCDVPKFDWPINASTSCCGGRTFLYYSARFNLPFLTEILGTNQLIENSKAADNEFEKRKREAGKINIASAFWIAASEGHEQTVRSLLYYNEYFEWHERNQGTALHEAVWQGHKAIVKRIVDYCVAEGKHYVLKATNDHGQTPLDYALSRDNEHKDPEIIDMLLEAQT